MRWLAEEEPENQGTSTGSNKVAEQQRIIEESIHKSLRLERKGSGEHLLPGGLFFKKGLRKRFEEKDWCERDRGREAGRVSLGVGVDEMGMCVS